jgi:hypothetical protein
MLSLTAAVAAAATGGEYRESLKEGEATFILPNGEYDDGLTEPEPDPEIFSK